jgi:hypothetical protein
MGKWMNIDLDTGAGGEWSASCPGRFPMPAVSIGYEAGWVREPVLTTSIREKSCPYSDSNSIPSPVQSIEGLRKIKKTLTRERRVPVEIRTEHFPNISLDRYRYGILSDVKHYVQEK